MRKRDYFSWKDYVRGVLIVAVCMISFGILMPYLISMDSDETVALGLFVLCALPLVCWFIIKPTVQKIIRRMEQ